MRRLILLIAASVAAFFLAVPSSIAFSSEKGIRIERLQALGDGTVLVDFESNLPEQDFSVTARILELDAYDSSGPFRVIAGGSASRKLLLGIPGSARGEHYVRVVVNSGSGRRVRHRLVVIE